MELDYLTFDKMRKSYLLKGIHSSICSLFLSKPFIEFLSYYGRKFYMKPILNHPVLVMIDVQKGFEEEKWGERNNLQAEKNMEQLLSTWRLKRLPIIHVQHLSQDSDSSFYPGKPGVDFKEFAKPLKGEMLIQKRVNSAFIGTNLEEHLKQKGLNHVVIAGLTTPHCVSTTTRMSGNLGFNTFLISDATAAFGITGPNDVYYSPDEVHNLSIATLQGEFATVLTTRELMASFDRT